MSFYVTKENKRWNKQNFAINIPLKNEDDYWNYDIYMIFSCLFHFKRYNFEVFWKIASQPSNLYSKVSKPGIFVNCTVVKRYLLFF